MHNKEGNEEKKLLTPSVEFLLANSSERKVVPQITGPPE